MSKPGKLPHWADVTLVPLTSVLIAFILSAVLIWAIGESPWAAVKLMVDGAFGSSYGWGYTLFYATNFMFTGLAVAVAFQARLFNIGGEGQALLGGLGVALVCLYIPWPHWSLALIAACLGAGLFGAAWAFIPGYLQAKRGSHIVITTIMFNFIAASVLGYVLVNILRPQGSQDPSSPRFPSDIALPKLHEILSPLGIPFSTVPPVNISLLIAVVMCFGVWFMLWRTRLGYQIRAFGESEPAAEYAGISPARITIYVMLISGALAGMMAVNSVMGEQQRLVLNAVEGAGFIGIAVALMGRNHPFGVALASILFGFLYQGGAELALWTGIPRELIVVIQALVILFTGALDNLVRMPLTRLFAVIGAR